MTFRTRFAPSPTGPLHLGHAYSALLAYDMACAAGGDFLLRIENIDQSRARAEWEDLIYEDLDWLGIKWAADPVRQSDRLRAYRDALNILWQSGSLFPCNCTRRDIAAALTAPQEGGASLTGPDGVIYPGTCRNTSDRTGTIPEQTALRLDMSGAAQKIGTEPLSFTETGAPTDNQAASIHLSPQILPTELGDIVLARRDMGTSYHLSVVLDDAHQGITHVVRGEDLYEATQIHVVLQRLLDLPTPIYHHHRLIRDNAGKRLAKRDDVRAIRKYREDGLTPADIRARIGL